LAPPEYGAPGCLLCKSFALRSRSRSPLLSEDRGGVGRPIRGIERGRPRRGVGILCAMATGSVSAEALVVASRRSLRCFGVRAATRLHSGRRRGHGVGSGAPHSCSTRQLDGDSFASLLTADERERYAHLIEQRHSFDNLVLTGSIRRAATSPRALRRSDAARGTPSRPPPSSTRPVEPLSRSQASAAEEASRSSRVLWCRKPRLTAA
jgi:hypothetical protein